MLRLARPLGASARRQLLTRLALVQARGYAERSDSLLSSDPSFKSTTPKSTSPAKPTVPVVPPSSTASPAATTTIPPANVPKEPPPPVPSKATGPAIPVPPPAGGAVPDPKPPRKRFSGSRLLLYLLLISVLGYSGAVAFALNNDNFHDFFTEYVPLGEDIVLYFEERSFHKRFPNAKISSYRSTPTPRPDDKKVTIPGRSGLSWKVSEDEKKDGSDVTGKGKHMSAVETRPVEKAETQQNPASGTQKEKAEVVDKTKADAGSGKSEGGGSKPVVLSSEDAKPKKVPETISSSTSSTAPSTPASSDSRPPLIAPVTQISPVNVANAEEPVVQELVKIINDLITVVNSDDKNSANKYSAPFEKARDAFTAAASKIGTIRDAERAAAEERVKEAHKEFDEGAKNLIARFETAQGEQDIKYREEFEAERAKLTEQYENKLKAEIERTQQVLEQRWNNELSEQGIKLKRKFVDDIKSLVETERDGRLSKLSDLSTNVDDLTQLTTNWNGVIDANLATQKLQVAVDAVRSALDSSNSNHKPKPFVREMAALKLVADNDPIVDAAVASITPAAYQKGIPSSAQLIDRFRRVASEVRKASLLPEDAGIASHAASMVLSRVMFKKQGVPEGDDVESILTRTETLLEEGDLDNAAREMNGLKGWAGVLSKDWMSDVRKVLEVQQALDVIETEARLNCLRVG